MADSDTPNTAAAKAASKAMGRRLEALLRTNPDTSPWAEQLIENGPDSTEPLHANHLLTFLGTTRHAAPDNSGLDAIAGRLRGWGAAAVPDEASAARHVALDVWGVLAEFAKGYNSAYQKLVAEYTAAPPPASKPLGSTADTGSDGHRMTQEERYRAKAADLNAICLTQGFYYQQLDPQYKLKDACCSLITDCTRSPPQAASFTEHFATGKGYYVDVHPGLTSAGSQLKACMFNLFRCTSGLAPPWATLGSQDDNAPSITVNEVYGKTLFDLNVLYVLIDRFSDVDRINNKTLAVQYAKDLWGEVQTMLANNQNSTLTALFMTCFTEQSGAPTLGKIRRALLEQGAPSTPGGGGNNNANNGDSRGKRKSSAQGGSSGGRTDAAKKTVKYHRYPPGACKEWCRGSCSKENCRFEHDPDFKGKFPKAGEPKE